MKKLVYNLLLTILLFPSCSLNKDYLRKDYFRVKLDGQNLKLKNYFRVKLDGQSLNLNIETLTLAVSKGKYWIIGHSSLEDNRGEALLVYKKSTPKKLYLDKNGNWIFDKEDFVAKITNVRGDTLVAVVDEEESERLREKIASFYWFYRDTL